VTLHCTTLFCPLQSSREGPNFGKQCSAVLLQAYLSHKLQGTFSNHLSCAVSHVSKLLSLCLWHMCLCVWAAAGTVD
jgi:hypothetical protein